MNTNLNKDTESNGNNIKEFLSELIKTILPKHTVVIILMIIMGYFLFYPTVRDTKIYEKLIESNFNSLFIYIYSIFGLIYLIGGMYLILEINKQNNEAENKKEEETTKRIEIETSTNNFREEYFIFEKEMLNYIIETLGVPENKIKKEFKIDKFIFDVVIFDVNNNPIAVAEFKKIRSLNKNIINSSIEQLKKYISNIQSFKGGYLFTSSDKGLEISFYNSKLEKINYIPNYEQLNNL